MGLSAQTSLNKQILQLSLPLAGTQLANIALATTDTLVMGHLGVAALAGGGLAVVLFNQLRTMAVGLLTPLGNRIAQVHTRYEKNPDEASRAEIQNLTRSGLLLATITGVVGAVILIGLSYALPYFGQTEAVTRAAEPMMWALAPGLIPCLWFQVSRQFSVGLSKPQSLLGITLAMVVVNAALNLVLGFGYGPFPQLGVVGVGLATTIVHLASAAVYLVLIERNRDINEFHRFDFWTLSPARLRELLGPQLRLGLPVGATYGAEAGMFTVLAFIMGSFGAEALAAHNVVYQITFIVFQIGTGFSHGSSLLISRAFAVDDLARARVIGARTVMMMAGVVGTAAILFIAGPRFVLSPFLEDPSPETLSLAASLLFMGALMNFVDIGQNLAVGALRGINDTSTGLKASLVGYWVVGLPAALLFAFPLALGPHGIWFGLATGLSTSCTLLWFTFVRKTRVNRERL